LPGDFVRGVTTTVQEGGLKALAREAYRPGVVGIMSGLTIGFLGMVLGYNISFLDDLIFGLVLGPGVAEIAGTNFIKKGRTLRRS